ncbi:hypothetical protein B0T21DRAFT_289370 [Apiosordaria backusii]|uniref:Uncharacterized protein n=1 Tax=Apiosordaria backusii TaxID=314023 RepID=A0AA40BL54_9PEZI|nr:hypothetical protein B0T21DRAFT_289370 [Apiosordaria backusii]
MIYPYGFRYIRNQLCADLPIPTKSYTGQTVIVTGSNVGLGLEAARYFVKLDAAKVILAVRSVEKGEAAKQDIISSTSVDKGPRIEVWELDLCIYESVKNFALRVERDLDSLDVVVENAGVFMYDFLMAGEDEMNITVNVVSTLLLGVLLLPKLRETSARTNKEGVLTMVGSWTHWLTPFSERKAEHIFARLANKKESGNNLGENRYYVSKLVQLLCVRQLAEEITKKSSEHEGNVVVSVVNPGFVKTQIMRNASAAFHVFLKGLQKALSRTAEQGARTLMHGAAGGHETHGKYLDDCKVSEPSVWVLSPEGQETQRRLWAEFTAKLERIQPGILQNIRDALFLSNILFYLLITIRRCSVFKPVSLLLLGSLGANWGSVDIVPICGDQMSTITRLE